MQCSEAVTASSAYSLTWWSGSGWTETVKRDLDDQLASFVLCWLGHLASKTVPKMTHNVPTETLTLYTLSYAIIIIVCFCVNFLQDNV